MGLDEEIQKLSELEEINCTNEVVMKELEQINNDLTAEFVKKDKEIADLKNTLQAKESSCETMNEQIRKHCIAMKLKEGSEESLNKEIALKESNIAALENEMNEQEKIANESKQAVIDVEKKLEE